MSDRDLEAVAAVVPCRFGYVEYDGDQYCHEHGGFRHFYVPGSWTCDRARGTR